METPGYVYHNTGTRTQRVQATLDRSDYRTDWVFLRQMGAYIEHQVLAAEQQAKPRAETYETDETARAMQSDQCEMAVTMRDQTDLVVRPLIQLNEAVRSSGTRKELQKRLKELHLRSPY